LRKLLFLFIWLMPLVVRADTLSAILEAALNNNPEIRAAKEEERISEFQYREAIARFFPEISLQYARVSLSDVPGYSMVLPVLLT